MKILYTNWNSIKEVPELILTWTREIGGNNITLYEINELVKEYQDYLAKLDETEQHEPTID